MFWNTKKNEVPQRVEKIIIEWNGWGKYRVTYKGREDSEHGAKLRREFHFSKWEYVIKRLEERPLRKTWLEQMERLMTQRKWSKWSKRKDFSEGI